MFVPTRNTSTAAACSFFEDIFRGHQPNGTCGGPCVVLFDGMLDLRGPTCGAKFLYNFRLFCLFAGP
jgi:hypothetical protein